MRVEEFIYPLPESAIAQEPIEPRHDSRLLDTRDLTDHRFLDLPQLLAPGDLVVVNDTRVRSARLVGVKAGSGGRVELLVLRPLADGQWEAMARPSRRLRPGTRIELPGLTATVVTGPENGLVVVDLEAGDVDEAIELAGEMPLPPYFKGHLADPDRYQTMFARLAGSAAAPTAGLHFTDEVVAGLGRRGIEVVTIDLHVGIDTFRPMTVEMIEDHRMHTEWCSVPAATVDAIRCGTGTRWFCGRDRDHSGPGPGVQRRSRRERDCRRSRDRPLPPARLAVSGGRHPGDQFPRARLDPDGAGGGVHG